MSASTPTSPGEIDWGIGRYEHTAAQLMPTARLVVDHAALTEGEHVVDIGCGIGNAALMAAAEMARVTAPNGRIVLCAWIPVGPISESGRVAAAAVFRALGLPARRPFAWHDRDALAGLFAPHGFEVEVAEKTHAFTASSPGAYAAWEFESHPLWVAGGALLEPRGEAEDVRARALEILEAANEDPAGFRVTSRYVVATARRR
jgi:SAM-dependent methyltransferase